MAAHGRPLSFPPSHWFVVALWGVMDFSYVDVVARPVIASAVILATGTSAADWLAVGLIFAVGLVAIVGVRRVIRHLDNSKHLQPQVSGLLTRFWTVLIVLIAMVYAFRQLGVQVGPLLGALGVGGLIIAMSLQPVLGNLVGSMLIDARRPIRRGDQISSNGYEGTVIDINGRAVVMMSFDGERVHLPNLNVLDNPLVNKTANEFRRTVIPFQVSYDSDLRRTQRVLSDAFREMVPLADSPGADIIVTGFGSSGIDLAARIWHPAEELTARWVVSEVVVTIHETLAAEGIEIPFPQLVVHKPAKIEADDAIAKSDATAVDLRSTAETSPGRS